MKRFLFIYCLLVCTVAGNVYAQTPQYSTPQGSSNNIFPFGSSSSNNKVQWLYQPTDFTVMPPTGMITKVYFKTWSSTYSATYSNFDIKIGMTSLTGLPTTNVFVTGLTTAYSATSLSIPSTSAYTWFSITLQNPIPYTTGTNFIIEIEHNGITSGAITANCQGTFSTTRRIWGNYGATTGTGNGTSSFGDIGLDIQTGPPCPGPSGLSATGITSTAASLSWGAVSGSTGYDYIIDQNATVPFPNTPTTTTNTSVNATGLASSTTYYLHVRNRCSSTNFSPWVDYSFTTLPPCKPPVGFNVTNLVPTSATINWNAWASALNYDYIVDQSNTTPTSTTAATNTLLTTANLSGLQENTWYFVHIRSHCVANETSDWSLDSFLTPIPCRPPVIQINHINTNEAVADWPPVPTALYYEYVITTSSTPPVLGTKYNFTSIHTSALDDGKEYFIFVRSHCKSLNIESTSDWGMASFKTFPTTIKNTNGDAFSLIAYPNPVKDIMTLKIVNGDGNGSISITDLNGRIIFQTEANRNTININCTGYAPGVYLLKYTDRTHTEVMRIIK